MITFRSYHAELITTSQSFITRTSVSCSRMSTGVGTARSSRRTLANAFAFSALPPAIPTPPTPLLPTRSRTADPRHPRARAPPQAPREGGGGEAHIQWPPGLRRGGGGGGGHAGGEAPRRDER